MKIAICDDCLEDIKHLRTLIEEDPSCPDEAEFFDYTSGEELLENYQNFDVVFLDMQMGGMNGKQTAGNIRKRDSELILSFCSGFEAAAHQILSSRPLRYMLKDSREETLSSDIHVVLMETLRKKQVLQIWEQYYGTTAILKSSDILYISIRNKGSIISLNYDKGRLKG